jgi:cAMP phosphodiesterase
LSLEEQSAIRHILVTHAHLDHVKDIAFLLDNLYLMGRTDPVVLVSTASIISVLQTHLFNNHIWPDFSCIPSPEAPILRFQAIDSQAPLLLDGVTVTSVEVNHTVETVGYIVEAMEGAAVFIGDTGPTVEVWDAVNKTKNVKAIFIETSLPNSMGGIAHLSGHLTPHILEQELQKLEALHVDIFLYHMKLQYHEFISKELAAISMGNIHVLDDGQVITIKRS